MGMKPQTSVLAILARWGGFMPFGGGFIPPFGSVSLTPHRGGFIPAKGWFYPSKRVVLSPHWVFLLGGYHPFGVVLSPLFGDFIAPLGSRGGVVTFLTQHHGAGRQVALGLYVVL